MPSLVNRRVSAAGMPVRQYGVECQFGEPFSSRALLGLKEKYFDKGVADLWATLPNVCALGRKLCPDNSRYRYLDAAQLVKHVLGLRRCSGTACPLLYLYYDVSGPAGVQHAGDGRAAQKVDQTPLGK